MPVFKTHTRNNITQQQQKKKKTVENNTKTFKFNAD